MLSKMDGSRGHVAELEPTADLVIDTVSLKIKRTPRYFHSFTLTICLGLEVTYQHNITRYIAALATWTGSGS